MAPAQMGAAAQVQDGGDLPRMGGRAWTSWHWQSSDSLAASEAAAAHWHAIYLGIEITRTKNGFLLTQQRLVDSIYEKAKAYIDKYQIASMDVPIKFNRLKKATSQPTPEEHLELRQLPFRSLLGAVGYFFFLESILQPPAP